MEGGLEEARNASLKQSETLLKQAADSLARLRANPDASAQGAPLFDQMLAAYAAFADSDPGAHAEGDTGLERHRGESPGRQGAAGQRRVVRPRPTRPMPASAARRRWPAPAIPWPGVILVAAVVLGLVVLLAVLIRLAFRRGILRPLNEAGAHFDRIADGDLTGAIALRGDNEIGVLYSAMRRMQTGLTEAVASVRHGVEEIHTGSGEIAAGGADMSDRTARQAGSLQEAAANMTQLAHTVQLATPTRPAAQSAATGPARRQAVDEVVQSMRGIADSARRIGEIVGVVDSIAFQTNILALNAAVEARAPASRARASPWSRARCVRWRSAARRRPRKSRA